MAVKDEVIINCRLAEAAARRTAAVDVDQVNLVKGKRKKQGQGRQGEEG